ncbi:hypothetical protein [Lysobacter panacisoli]|uniref:DUF3592 domain-containing protein n=1 Tax=Lysobacter panacisoli TaxID=1255263 RepID=A0ABP9LIY7_9GAMM|nr:hypothetical protein [Lysobacter panacisoli]
MTAARWIPLIWLGMVVVSTAVAGWVVLWHRLTTQETATRLQQGFDALLFDTPVGRVSGDTLTVVKIAYRLDEASPELHPRGGPEGWDSLWYASGPGPSYFLAVCRVDMESRSPSPRWNVRELDESHMRTALEGDRRAEMLAFGEAIEA